MGLPHNVPFPNGVFYILGQLERFGNPGQSLSAHTQVHLL